MFQKIRFLRKVSLVLGIAMLIIGLVPGTLASFSGITDVYAEGEVTPTEEPAPAETLDEEQVSTDAEAATVVEESALPEVTEYGAAVESDPAEAAVQEAPTDEVLVEEVAQDPATDESVEEADFSEVVEVLAESGAVLVDENNEPVALTSIEAVEILTAADPYFTRDLVTYYYLTDCTGYPVNCTVSANPIQAAIDDVTANGLPDDGTIYVEAGTYEENLSILVDDLTLFGDPGNTLVSGAGLNAPVLEGTNLGGNGIFIDGNGVSIIGFVIQNFTNGIFLNASGNSGFTAENNTIQNNDAGVYNKNAVPGVELHYNDFNNNILAIQNDDVRGLQFIQAQNNYWGCQDGPIVQYWDDDDSEWMYVLWATKAEIDPANYPGCQLLYGENSKWDHQIQTADYSPFKINLGKLAGPEVFGCTDDRALNFNPDATTDDGSCEFEEEIVGCLDSGAVNYDPYATISNEHCEYNLELDPYCVDGENGYLLAWEIINPNSFNVDASWSLDGNAGAATLSPGVTFIGYTEDGPATHTLNASWEFGQGSLSSSTVCAPVNETPPNTPETPTLLAVVEELLIPVTGADYTLQSMLPFGGMLLVGISLLAKGVSGKIKK